MIAARFAPTLTSLALCLACTATPEGLTTRLEAPGRPPIELALRDDPRGPTWTLATDPERTAGGLLLWHGAWGQVVERRVLDRAGTGPVSGRAPAFAATWQVALRLGPPGPVPRFLVAGGPVLPSLALGHEHLTYLVEVVAPNLSEALSLASPVDEGLVDAPLRPAVEVLLHVVVERDQPDRLSLRVSDTGEPRGVRVHLDDAALVADHGAAHAWQHHELHGWHQLEASLPLEALAAAASPRTLAFELGRTPSSLARATFELDLHEERQPEVPPAP